jgi:hypothetical protein
MAFELLAAATTAGVTTQPKSFELYNFIVVTAPGLATTETVNIQIVGSQGAINLFGQFGAAAFQYQLTATAQALVLPGGFIYQFVKTSTAGAVPIEVHFSPRPT